MKPYFSHLGITLYHADCRDVLPTLPPNSIDAVLTDPPYGINYRSKQRRQHPELAASIAEDDSLNALRDATMLIDAALRPNRHAYVFAAPMRIGEVVQAVEQCWRVKNILVWDKGNCGSQGDCLAGYSQNWEAIVYASKGRRPLIGPPPRCIYRYDWQAHRDPVHPTVKPVGMMAWLMAKSSERGEVVLDPFAGSGTVLRAAAELGRRAIGIEIEEQFCEVAARRIMDFTKNGAVENKPPQNPQNPQNV